MKIIIMSLNVKFVLYTNLILILNVNTIFLYNKSSDDKGEDEKKGKKIQETDNRIRIRPIFDYKKEYEKTIDYIKWHEGYASGNAYTCPGGHRTIGYGHVILKGENLSRLTKEQADSLLRVDFNKAIKLLKDDKKVNLKDGRKLAIAHFIFTKGIGSYYKSTLRKKIINNQKIDDELLKWIYYTNSKGEKIKSSHALKIRKWELSMYNMQLT